MSDDEMKTIDDKVKDLEIEMERLVTENKGLLSQSEVLNVEVEKRKNRYSQYNFLFGSLFSVAVFLGLFSLLLFIEALMGVEPVALLYSAGLSWILFVALLFFGSKYKLNRWKRLGLEYEETLSDLEKNQALIRQNEIRMSELSEGIFALEQKKRGFVGFVDRLGRKRFGTPEQVKEWKIMDMDMRNGFSKLKPREFEKLIRELFVKIGYEASLTPYTADFGADVVARKGTDTIVIQVKKYGRGNRVGSPEVQRLLGSMFKYKANKAIFVTTSEFTDEAQEQARGAPIELWNYTILNEKIEQYLLNLKKIGFKL